MAEAFNSLYKWELIYPQGPWRGLDDVEFATLGYIDWFNHRRLHGEITDDNTYVTPAEFEALYYRQTTPALEAVTQTTEQSRNPGRFTAPGLALPRLQCNGLLILTWCWVLSMQGATVRRVGHAVRSIGDASSRLPVSNA